MFMWMVLIGCVSEHSTTQRTVEVDSVEAIVEVTPRSNAKGWFVELDIMVNAPPEVFAK